MKSKPSWLAESWPGDAISAPPQHGKSACVSESLPSWYLGQHPTHNIIMASYDSEFAERFCRKNKDKIKRCGRTLFNNFC